MIVTLDEILPKAQAQHYAVGLFNTINMEMLQGVLEAAEQLNAPVIIGTAEVLLPFGELDLIAPSIIAAAKKSKVPVVVHFDHGLTFERCLQAMKLGFSSIMYDCSTLLLQENMENVKLMTDICHGFGCSIEAELGHVGQCDDVNEDIYTSTSEAVEFVDKTNVDALAVAIGTAHGNYIKKPILNIERLKQIRANVDTPLVLHGGSGLSDEDFTNTIKNGIAKVNIFTDLCNSSSKAMEDGLSKKKSFLDIRNMQVEYIKQATIKKMKLFGCENKA